MPRELKVIMREKPYAQPELVMRSRRVRSAARPSEILSDEAIVDVYLNAV